MSEVTVALADMMGRIADWEVVLAPDESG